MSSLQDLLLHTSDLFVETDAQGSILAYNTTWTKLGYQHEQLLHTCFFDLFSPKDALHLREQLHPSKPSTKHKTCLQHANPQESSTTVWRVSFNPQDQSYCWLGTLDKPAEQHPSFCVTIQNKRMRLLKAIHQAVFHSQTLEGFASLLSSQLKEEFSCSHAALFQWKNNHLQLIPLAPQDTHTEPLLLPFSKEQLQELEIFREGRWITSLLTPSAEYPRKLLQWLLRERIQYLIPLPLYHEGSPWHGLLLLGRQEVPRFEQDDWFLAREIADSLMIAIAQLWLLERSRQDANALEILLREVNHRVKNNLSSIIGMLFLEKHRPPPYPPFQELIHTLLARVESLASLHGMLSASRWQPIPLVPLCEQVIDATLRNRLCDKPYRLTLSCAPPSLTIESEQARHLALLLNELTTNLLKHAAHPPPNSNHNAAAPTTPEQTILLHVAIHAKESILHLEFSNNNQPFPDTLLQDPSQPTQGIGLRLLQRLIHANLQGTLSFHNQPHPHIRLAFPLAEASTTSSTNEIIPLPKEHEKPFPLFSTQES